MRSCGKTCVRKPGWREGAFNEDGMKLKSLKKHTDPTDTVVRRCTPSYVGAGDGDGVVTVG